MKRFDELITTRKTPALFKVLFWKNKKKIGQNYQFSKISIFQKFPFFAIFLEFLRNWTLHRARDFCVAISALKRFIWSIKHPHTMIFIFCLIMLFFFNFQYRGHNHSLASQRWLSSLTLFIIIFFYIYRKNFLIYKIYIHLRA